MRHLAQWTAPAPFWTGAPDRADASRLAMRRPALLRFASDEFMDDFNRTLETDPPKLRDLEAKYETWKEPIGSSPVVAAPKTSISTTQKRLSRLRVAVDRKTARLSGGSSIALLERGLATTDTPPLLKLYQPAHQRHYLVTAALVCRLPGLPDRTIDASNQEKAAFVLRRIRTIGTGASATTWEYGFIPSRTGGSWKRIDDPSRQFADQEERLALFSVNFHDDEGHARRVMAGVIPAGKREVYVGSPEADLTQAALPPPVLGATIVEPGAPFLPSDTPKRDARIALLHADVIQPWKALIQLADRVGQTMRHEGNAKKLSEDPQALDKAVRDAHENIQVGSWYILLDFARFLEKYLGNVWKAIQAESAATLSDPDDLKVWQALDVALPTDSTATLLKILNKIHPHYGPLLEAATDPFRLNAPSAEWPDFRFPLVDIPSGADGFTGVAPNTTFTSPASGLLTDLQKALRKLSALSDVINAALPDEVEAGVKVPDLPVAAQRVMAPDERPMFVIRCVLERPDCVEPPLFSDQSEPFELANFFDPDAPARPIRIALPVDTSPAGLRRAPKNAAFMMSDILCGQVNRAKSMGFIDLVLSVLPWPLHKDLEGGSSACKADGDSIGMICSLSIPIITICALIILIIMVTLLDIIFKWLPYLIFCFPLPKFSGKPKVEAP
jgi:hypothetical protein